VQGLFWETSRLLLHFAYQQALIQAPQAFTQGQSAAEMLRNIDVELPVDPRISAESPRQGLRLESDSEIQVASCPQGR
jgi:hypothetical protein